MYNRNEAFISEIIDRLYDEDCPRLITLPERSMRLSHFRLGLRDEWQKSFSPSQIDRTTRMIPRELRERFGWLSSVPYRKQDGCRRDEVANLTSRVG
jgi:hypothetical protein